MGGKVGADLMVLQAAFPEESRACGAFRLSRNFVTVQTLAAAVVAWTFRPYKLRYPLPGLNMKPC